MEENVLATEDFDSVANAVYQAIDDSPSQRMDFERQIPTVLSEKDNNEADDEEAYDEDDEELRHEMDDCAVSPFTNDYQNTSLEHYDNEDDAVGDADIEDEAEADAKIGKPTLTIKHRYHVIADDIDDDGLDNDSLEQNHHEQEDKKSHRQSPESRVYNDKDGMIKKITIANKKLLAREKSAENFNTKSGKIKDCTSSAFPEDKLTKQQRSSTPFSREYIALQKSVNDSKVLTEFVTDASVVKTRKLRRKKLITRNILPTTPTSEHSYSSKRWRNAPKQEDLDVVLRIMSKKQHSKRFVPLKDEPAGGGSAAPDGALARSSRSRSLYNNYSDNSNSNSELKKRSKSVQRYDSDSSTHSSLLNKWPSEENINASTAGAYKRTNMRSENSDFVQKQKEFLQQVKTSTQNTPQRRSRSRSRNGDTAVGGNNVIDEKKIGLKSRERTSKRFKGDVEAPDEDSEMLLGVSTNDTLDDVSVNTSNNSIGAVNTSGEVEPVMDNFETFVKNVWQPPPKPGSDSFCWKCHESKVNLACSRCIRSYHAACAKVKVDNMWVCPECIILDNILNSTKKSRRNEMPLDLLSQLLSFALKRMRYAKGHYSFHMPYEEDNCYKRIIVNPVTFDSMQAKIEAKEYRCADEFVNDSKWLLHNATILAFGNNTKTIAATKGILKICRQEANEIETCAECYLNANTRTDWFVDVCSQPHLLLWAKLKGFPYWPAKAMGFGPHSLVNVKFFGEHDRAFVPIKDCYLYSVQDPNSQTGKRAAKELADCIKEVGEHIERIIAKVGGFSYAPFKTPYDPADEMRQLENMMPGVQEFMKRQQGTTSKPSLQFKIYKTADNNMSIIQKDLSTGLGGSDISNPLLLQQQQQQQQHLEADDLVPHKKKKGFISPPPTATSTDEKNLDNINVTAAKYEVILKVSSDDSNSSKLSPVILKRKSTNDTDNTKKPHDDIEQDFCPPKLARIEERAAANDQNSGNHSLKRKAEIATNNEKSKMKHTKPQEMKIPIVAIKAIAVSKEIPNEGQVNKSSLESSDPLNSESPQVLQQPLSTSQSVASQKAVESIVKNKQGVTIKKIAKPTITSATTATITAPAITTMPTSSSSALLPANTPSVSHVPAKDDANMIGNISPDGVEKSINDTADTAKDKTDEQKQRDVVNNILKGLKPFVEVKQEVLSDKEQEEEQPSNVTDTQQADTSTNAVKEQKSTNTKNIVPAKDSTRATQENAVVKDTCIDTILVQVKEEIFSDEEEAIDDNAPLLPELSALNTNQALPPPVSVRNVHDVCLVGDTVIQKLSVKNAANQPVNNNSVATAAVVSSSNKRNTLKGIPYGPLPASALPKTSMQSLQNEALALNPRAKKSFPQLSPPISMNSYSNAPNLVTTNPTSSMAGQSMDMGKKPLARTTMVAIPVDYGGNASQSCNSAGMTMMSSIPVPPLTAVSKISSTNAMAHNNTATVTVSGISGILTSPSVITQNQTAPVVTSSSSSSSTSLTSNVTGKSPLSSALTTCTSLYSTTTSVTARKSPITAVAVNNKTPASLIIPNPKNALTLSTPPPLAGLSGTSLNNSAIATTTTETTTATTSLATTNTTNATATQTECSSDTQLLSGLVMPTLATAMTDIMSRGPPKLAARPRGPLQSEGYPMHNSQAGPVSKVFVENAHKITDYFISVMEDTMSEIAQGSESSLQARVVLLEKEMERTKLLYEQQMAELRRTSELMRITMENDKTRTVNEIRKQCEAERIRSIEETKRKQWCAQCRREANFYCCWNTSYCGYPCQQLHWGKHAPNCAQTRPNVDEARHSNKSNNSASSSINSPANYNAKSVVSSMSVNHFKKEKAAAKSSSSNNMMSSQSQTNPSALPNPRSSNTHSGDLPKLPINTYLRPLPSTSVSAQALRCNTTYSIPVQRFNVPLPITSHVNTSGPHTFTIVRQGNGWSGPVHMATNAANSTIAAPIASVPPQGQTHRQGGGGGGGPVLAANKSTKNQIRYH